MLIGVGLILIFIGIVLCVPYMFATELDMMTRYKDIDCIHVLGGLLIKVGLVLLLFGAVL